MTASAILKIENLKKYYHVTAGLVARKVGDIRAVDDISLQMNQGEVLGLVGESGCGKSTLGKAIIRLEEPTSGEIYFDGTDVIKMSKHELRKLRGKIQIVFQDPDSSLDPRMTVGDSIDEALIVHDFKNPDTRNAKVAELLEKVGLEAGFAHRYPHEFSGGQRQRIGIARALAMDPKLVIADEPVSALDVSVQAQILNLMMDIKEKDGLAYLFISHDLSVVRYISNRVAVMYLGKIVELAEKNEFFNNPLHPYTEALLSAIATLRPGGKEKILLKGDVPSPLNPPSGCRFHTRCHRVMPVCSQKEPEFKEIGPHHYTACHLY
ncbi:MAG: dipeptide ABC transporter ATP-binding protein [Dehalococcoidia bacterium]|nr:dipeptide ABC transporter ATP-binding protein [Dehalococcoidia bacterium]MDD5494445.1 dipeptide ABC transporter ATP-binding protein [Dehalococcoidia bacterium]